VFTESVRERRRAATKDEILAAAWTMVRADGLSALSMRDLGKRVGMTAGALYRYFPSKMHIYDALFADGHVQLQAQMRTEGAPEDPQGAFRDGAHRLMAFCVADPTRYALLFQRPVPGFEPSEESMALARRSYQQLLEQLTALQVTDQSAVDLWAAIHMGLTGQQVANDPGGDRWAQLVDEAVDMFLAHQHHRVERTHDGDDGTDTARRPRPGRSATRR
jgi:AcrR family transcriptional regulator